MDLIPGIAKGVCEGTAVVMRSHFLCLLVVAALGGSVLLLCRFLYRISRVSVIVFFCLMSCKTDDNGNAMLQSFLCKLFRKETAEDTLVPPLWGTR